MNQKKAAEMEKRIDKLLQKVTKAAAIPGSFGYLPAIYRTLIVMKEDIYHSREVRNLHSSGFGRILTEDFSFSESKLGGELLKFADDYDDMPE